MLYDSLRDFAHLCFPNCCACCGRKLFKGEDALCLFCETGLPMLNDFYDENNSVAKLFWGKVKLEHSTAVYQFRQKGMMQRIMHAIKYNGRSDVAQKVGKIMAHEVGKHKGLASVDCVMPVPLHKRRQKERGYNQSEELAKGLTCVWGKCLDTTSLQRHTYSKSQTKKDRLERWNNVNNIFGLSQPIAIEGKHVLLVDDVVTTGSTLEACTVALQQVSNVKVSVLALAFPTYD